jgi:hypothetical protein
MSSIIAPKACFSMAFCAMKRREMFFIGFLAEYYPEILTSIFEWKNKIPRQQTLWVGSTLRLFKQMQFIKNKPLI